MAKAERYTRKQGEAAWMFELKKYRPIQFESLVAFPRWLQAVKPDVDAAGNIGQATFKTFVEKISEALLNWVDGWRKPRSESPLYDG